MLVLGRKEGQGIYLGPDIVVRLLKQKGGGARLAIEAPPHVRVLRTELAEELGDVVWEERPDPARPPVAA